MADADNPNIENAENHIAGTDQADLLNGTDGNDSFVAGSGDDTVIGGQGNDYAEGGEGEDLLIGDAPSDVQFDPSVIKMVEDYTIQMTFESEGAGYQNSIGMYRVDPDTGLIQTVDMAWENASFAGSGGDLVGGQSSVDFDVSAGDQIGFFIIANGNGENDFASLGEGTYEFVSADGGPASVDGDPPILRHIAVDGTVTVLNGNIYHSASTQPDHGINIDGIDHTVAGSSNDVAKFQIGFEDLYGGGDRDFDDVVFSVEVGAVNGAAIMGDIDDGLGGGDDRLEGREGDDQIEGNSGDDLLVGGGASTEWELINGKWVFHADRVDSESAPALEGDDDVIVGGSGDDVLLGNGGDDVLYGGAGEDRFNGGTGDDSAFGGSGDDIINLQSGNDYAEGGAGADTVNAGDGDDVVFGDAVGENLLRTDGSEVSFADYGGLEAWESYTDPGTGMSAIVQQVETAAGEPYQLSFEVAANLAAGVTSGTMEVLFNGEVIDTIDVTSGVFQNHTVEIAGDGGVGSLSFRNIETSVEASEGAPVYDTSGPIMTYEKTVDFGDGPMDVSAFAPGQANLYQVISGDFKVFDPETNQYENVGDPFGFKVNAIGFNVEDDLIYGIAKSSGTDINGNPVSSKDLMMIDANGNAHRIGETPVGDYVGDFDGEGNLWTFQSSLNRITKIDVDNLDADGNPAVENYYLPGNLFDGRTYDVAYNSAENAFYAVEPPNSHGANGTVHKIDMNGFDGSNEPQITSVEISGTLVDDVMASGMAKGAYGAVFLDADGTLYAGLNKGDHDMNAGTETSGGIYKFELNFETGQGFAELLADTESTGSNDGASDPRALDPFAQVDTANTVLIRNPELTYAGGGDDDLRGGDGEDEMHGGAGDDLMFGQADDDVLFGDSGNDRMFGGDGDDRMEGGTGDDYMEGGAGADTLSGQAGNDRLFGKDGDDVLSGGDGADKLYGDKGNDVLDGGAGADYLSGGVGDDVLVGGDGADTMSGGSGDDALDGGAGNDQLMGGSGNDILQGGGGVDKLIGGSGSDTLEGGAGNDHLWGGNWSADGSSDTFAYSHKGGKDIIHDFEADFDQIDLSAYELSYEEIQDRMIDRGWALEINLEGIDKSGAGDKLLLKSVKAEDLDSDNFIV